MLKTDLVQHLTQQSQGVDKALAKPYLESCGPVSVTLQKRTPEKGADDREHPRR